MALCGRLLSGTASDVSLNQFLCKPVGDCEGCRIDIELRMFLRRSRLVPTHPPIRDILFEQTSKRACENGHVIQCHPSSTSRAHCLSPSISLCRYTVVDADVEWPSTAVITGRGTCSASILEASACLSECGPALPQPDLDMPAVTIRLLNTSFKLFIPQYGAVKRVNTWVVFACWGRALVSQSASAQPTSSRMGNTFITDVFSWQNRIAMDSQSISVSLRLSMSPTRMPYLTIRSMRA